MSSSWWRRRQRLGRRRRREMLALWGRWGLVSVMKLAAFVFDFTRLLQIVFGRKRFGLGTRGRYYSYCGFHNGYGPRERYLDLHTIITF
jgi:hypothetical protein